MGEVSAKQLKMLKEDGYGVGDEIGQFGLERRWENVLRGQAGGQQFEVDALGRRVRVLSEVADVPGYTVHLTRPRAETAYEALKDKQGTIVALDVHSGAILAMVSTPVLIPTLSPAASRTMSGALINDRLRPLSNRATQGQYPPGSTFKVIMAIAALKKARCN
jgi:penicillin-binding protein 2